MLEVSEAEGRAAALVEAAIRAGADAADVLYVGDSSTEVQVRLGELEDVTRSEGEEIGLRLFVGSRSASVSSSDLSKAALEALVERAAAMAREAPEDPWSGLAPEDRLLRGDPPALDNDDHGDPSPVELKQRALAMEETARAVAGITNSEGAGLSAGRNVFALATSHGFVGGYTASSYAAGIGIIAGAGDHMQRDHASHQARHFSDLDGPEELGRLAGERTVARLDPGKLASGIMPVVVDPHRRRGLRSRAFDGEGVATRPTRLVEHGRLTGWLLDSASARQLGLEPTGHATRGIGGSPGAGTTNVHLEPGSASPEELMADISTGLYVTGLIGQGVNSVTGDYSRGATGFIIDNGALAAPVEEITIAGNLLDMLRRLVAANDLEFRRAVNVPTLRIDGMTIAGA